MLQPHLHHAPHEDRKAALSHAVLLGGSTRRLPQAALCVSAQDSEARAANDEQCGRSGATGSCCRSSKRSRGPSHALDFDRRCAGLQLCNLAAENHLKHKHLHLYRGTAWQSSNGDQTCGKLNRICIVSFHAKVCECAPICPDPDRQQVHRINASSTHYPFLFCDALHGVFIIQYP